MDPNYLNDPMWLDIDPNGLTDLWPTKSRNEFAISFEGLPKIIDQTYSRLRCSYKNFERNVSSSMFHYYIWQHVYARIVAIKMYESLDYMSEDSCRIFKTSTLQFPLAIDVYLRSVGFTNDKTGMNYELKFPAWPNDEGHFGRVDENTHVLYETLAAPIILAERIKKDLEYTRQSNNGDRIWDIPNDISPINDNRGLPTKNLLGWDLKETLTPQQQKLIESAGISTENFKSNKKQFLFNDDLFLNISQCIGLDVDERKLGNSFYENGKGCASQLLWQCRDTKQEETFNRLKQYTEGTVKQMSCLDGNALKALLFSFRVKKEAVGSLHSYVCYDFNNHTEVPVEWQFTRNKIFQYGDVEVCNGSTFETAFTEEKIIFLHSWMNNIDNHTMKNSTSTSTMKRKRI